jgi:hypothetical protein
MTSNGASDPRLASLRRAVFLTAFPFGILMFALPLIGRNLGASALEIGGFIYDTSAAEWAFRANALLLALGAGLLLLLIRE